MRFVCVMQNLKVKEIKSTVPADIKQEGCEITKAAKAFPVLIASRRVNRRQAAVQHAK